MPGRGSKKKGDYWKKDHPDTGESLKFIHLQTASGTVPRVEDFLKSAVGKSLVEKWGGGKTGEKKIKYNFAQTLTRFKDWAEDAGDQGDFTAEQLTIAGLPLPERNGDRQGGLNINPGTDSEGEELNERAAENADHFGGEGGDVGGGTLPTESAPAASPEAEYSSSKKRVLFTTVEMTHTKRLHVIPGFNHDNTTKTMFLLVLELPGGIVTANPILNQDLMGATVSFRELGNAMNAAYLFQDVAAYGGQGHIIGHVRDDMEQEMVQDDQLDRAPDNSMIRTVDFVFPERSATFVFNPATHSLQHPLYVRHVTGGRTVVMTATWQHRDVPIFRGVNDEDLTELEQMQRARAFFPGLENRLLNQQQRHGAGLAVGADAAMLRRLNERMDRTEANLRAQFNRARERDRETIRSRLAQMTGAQIEALSREEFGALFGELGTELGEQPPQGGAAASGPSGSSGVETVPMDDEEY